MSTSQRLVTTAAADTDATRYSLLVAREEAEVRAAQRLRHQVFAGELGAVLHSPEPGLDVDEFDAHCDHLVVREDHTGQIVGTYRMLPPDGARSAGGLYCETEFTIPGLQSLRGRTRHFAPEQYRVQPRAPWDPETAPRPQQAGLPPLLRGYLRLGAWVCGPPAHDRDFDVADFLVLLCLDRMDSRYLRHFLGEAA